MRLKTLAHAAALAAATFALAPAAQAADGVDIKFSGYGTIAATVVGDNQLQFRRSAAMSKGVGNDLDIGDDSRFGLQANANFNHGLSAVGQVVAKRRTTGSTAGADKDFDPQVDWLYGQYQFLPSLNVRLGRVAVTTFLVSDSLNVGYAAPWLRAPEHVYATNPTETLDGVQLNGRWSLGGVNLSAQLAQGTGTDHLFAAVLDPNHVIAVKSDRLNVNVAAEWGSWMARVGSLQNKSDFTAFPGAEPLRDRFDSVGAQYDNGTALVMLEVARRSQNGQPLFGGQSLTGGKYGYVAAGWHFGDWLPMVMVSQAKQDSYAGPTRAKTINNAYGASLRYDVAPNISLKAQVDRYNARDSLPFIVPRAGNDKVNVYALGMDFVF